ncbi:hypothetical protein [Parasphingorhabdus cellanae]|uniref:LPXTG cell wall anchor domain-containing protein n=1 Tax=Parasphingorhabdus cellanae TaxID=2806553 RepID=A0ABX7T8V7_9SPHN|nr:hypothetical protein [Parasphingorhabdus cellanae]QTD56428.1 hypothetical protein J4G78_02165 [Parasphingorhabdus cellanae]
MADWVLSILMLSGAGLLAGGVYLIRTGKNKKQGILMLIASAVMFANVGIWTIPTADSSKETGNAFPDQPN